MLIIITKHKLYRLLKKAYGNGYTQGYDRGAQHGYYLGRYNAGADAFEEQQITPIPGCVLKAFEEDDD